MAINDSEVKLTEERKIPTPPSETSTQTEKRIYETLLKFLESPESNECVFPSTFDGEERKLVHQYSTEFGLISKSFGKKDRHVRVYKREEDVRYNLQPQAKPKSEMDLQYVISPLLLRLLLLLL